MFKKAIKLDSRFLALQFEAGQKANVYKRQCKIQKKFAQCIEFLAIT